MKFDKLIKEKHVTYNDLSFCLLGSLGAIAPWHCISDRSATSKLKLHHLAMEKTKWTHVISEIISYPLNCGMKNAYFIMDKSLLQFEIKIINHYCISIHVYILVLHSDSFFTDMYFDFFSDV
jgi:hypothetical protein